MGFALWVFLCLLREPDVGHMQYGGFFDKRLVPVSRNVAQLQKEQAGVINLHVTHSYVLPAYRILAQRSQGVFRLGIIRFGFF